jgi:hypothetical protein
MLVQEFGVERLSGFRETDRDRHGYTHDSAFVRITEISMTVE